ncbi:hypothetical protein SADUNF_Sadunf14G0097400 [Salix dunnii]|uniref:Uncharacterized protein n=1 Tax=Salix dunnii TaxID=1413687 RepID=A0A835JIZ2_9ROSI|nr:hypothetical protein SADUNF_Sadunf14G0097400 [Salix dunnii]
MEIGEDKNRIALKLPRTGTAPPEMWIPIPGEEIYAGEFKVNHSILGTIPSSEPSIPTKSSDYSFPRMRSANMLGKRVYASAAFKSSPWVFVFQIHEKDDDVALSGERNSNPNKKVHFVPDNRNKLLSASVDGLMCIFNTDNGDINNDDDLGSVMHVGTSIGKEGCFGRTCLKLWCLTHIESLSIWDWKDSRNEANLLEARSLASDSWTLDHVDYFVDCHYPGEGDSLWLIGGTKAGALSYFPVNYKGVRAIGSPEAILGGGHKGVVRSVWPQVMHEGGTFPEPGHICMDRW